MDANEDHSRINLTPVVLAHEPPFHIGNVAFRPSTREVILGDEPTVIEPRVMQLLVALKRANGAVVSKDDLGHLVWESRIVGDDAINRVVSRLRAVAEKHAQGAFRVETITKVGYRLAFADAALARTLDRRPPVVNGSSRTHAVGRKTLIFPASPRRRALMMGVTLLLLMIAAGVWWLRPSAGPAHSTTVRLAGFQILSTDLPANMGSTVNAEIAAAFNAAGVVGVSTASTAPPPGEGPAYALGGTIVRDGQTIRVITQVSNERSGRTLWSNNYVFDGHAVSKVPRHIAVAAGNVVRCGLFGASTYGRPLADAVLRDYMQFCQGHWDPNLQEGRKALVPAQRVVAAVPDFSWGWAAVAAAFWKVALSADDERLAEEARANGREAADRAVAIDSENSEALYIKSLLIDRHDWTGRESLLKRAVGARRLDCGCEHHQYGWMLANVGRLTDAVNELRQANDMLALYVYTPLTLANVLAIAGKAPEAKGYYDAAIELAPDTDFAERIAMYKAIDTADVELVSDPKLPLSERLRVALAKGYRAVASRDPGAKTSAVQALLALPQVQQDDAVARLLGDLGADREAFRIAARLAAKEYPGPSIFWYPSMRRTLDDPGFPTVATQLGLLRYWKTSHVIPDVCDDRAPPRFCKMI